jgi:hypothetical protein
MWGVQWRWRDGVLTFGTSSEVRADLEHYTYHCRSVALSFSRILTFSHSHILTFSQRSHRLSSSRIITCHAVCVGVGTVCTVELHFVTVFSDKRLGIAPSTGP